MDERLLKYIQGEVSPQETEQVVRWIDACEENRRQYMALRRLYEISLWNNDAIQVKRRINPRRFGLSILKYAAILTIAFAGALFYLCTQKEEAKMQTLYVPSGQRAELILADGTKVWLNSHSTLRFPEHFTTDARTVELEGEGYFAVTYDEKAPFTVKTYRYDIRVLGTEFNVKAYPKDDTFETSLLNGSVAVQESGKPEIFKIKPNECLSYKEGALQISPINDLNYFHWREGLFCFNNESIGDLIEQLELYYDVTILIQREELANQRYSGKFRIKDGIEHVLKVLQLNHSFDYTINDEKNEIIIK